MTLTEADLMEGDVTVAVSHSSVNYKDGLAITGKAPIIRKFPLIPGVDFAGTVTKSSHKNWKPGDQVILNGWGVGEQHNGGFAEMARVSGDWLVAVPKGWTTADAMAVGIAGYTAMLCVMALGRAGGKARRWRNPGDRCRRRRRHGFHRPSRRSSASRLPPRPAAREESEFLKKLGASTIIDRNEFNAPVKPLAKMRWAGAIDSVGSTTLANVISQINNDGTVAACGLAQGMDLPTSVAPFILRGVKLIGVNSVTMPLPRRHRGLEPHRPRS